MTVLARLYARSVVWLRWLIVLGWAAAAVWVTQQPHVNLQKAGAGLHDLAPVDLPAVQAELRAASEFPVPLRSRTLLVQHDPGGLDPVEQREIVRRVAPSNMQRAGWPDLLGGIPLVNRPPVAGIRAPYETTAVTYLIFDPSTSASQRTRQATRLAQSIGADDRAVGVTGAIPARISTAHLLRDSLPRLELLTAATLGLMIALFYLSFIAPIVVMLTVGVAYIVSQSALEVVASKFGFDVPREVEPLLVALLLGVVTDYAIFFLSAMRRHLRSSVETRQAIVEAVSETAPIVLVAALTVAAGCASLAFASTGFIAAFGPALALTVLVSAAVSLTLVPALLAIFGRAALWPFGAGKADASSGAATSRRSLTERMTRRLMSRPIAVVASIGVLVVLLAAASFVPGMRLGYDAISGLPADDPVAAGQQLARQGFAPGIVSPTTVLVEASGLSGRLPALARLQDSFERQPGVAGALGPATARDVGRLADPGTTLEGVEDPLGLAVTESGSAARLQLVLEDDPYGGRAVAALADLRDRLPQLAEDAGISDAKMSVAGDTAVVLELVDTLRTDMLRVTIGVVLLDLMLLTLYLRSLVAPVLVVGGSLLAVAAAIGTTTAIFQGLLDQDSIAFYVPLAAIVLLLSLGADYGVFSIGHAWQVARTRPFEDALVESAGQTSRVIAMAGVLLATSFALLLLVPIDAFAQFAVTMATGVLIDTFVIRPILLPALLRLVPWGRPRYVPPPRRSRIRSLLSWRPRSSSLRS